MSGIQPHAVFNTVVGAAQTGPALGPGDSVLFFLGANLTPAAAAAALTVASNVAMTAVLLTLGAAASVGSVPGVFPSECAVNGGALFYTLSGTGATSQLYWQTG